MVTIINNNPIVKKAKQKEEKEATKTNTRFVGDEDVRSGGGRKGVMCHT